jgi:hypothetical protein
MDVNELLQSLSNQSRQAAGGRSGDPKATPQSNGNLYVTRKEIQQLRRDLCELLNLLLNLHVTSEIDMEIPYMDIHLN